MLKKTYIFISPYNYVTNSYVLNYYIYNKLGNELYSIRRYNQKKSKKKYVLNRYYYTHRFSIRKYRLFLRDEVFN